MPIVTGATVWKCPDSGVKYILVIHEALYYGQKLSHSLINPNPPRHNGIDYWDNPFDKTRPMGIDIDGGPFIPLELHGTKSLFSTRAPSNKELNECPHIHLTSINQWNPQTVQLGQLCSTPDTPVLDHDSKILQDIEPSLVMLKELKTVYDSNSVTDELVPSQRSFVSNKRHTKLNAQQLAEFWGIGPRRAHDTIKVTTQRGTRSAILPISRRYRADKMFNTKRLESKFSTDTMYPELKSLNQNTCAQVYSTKFGFNACYPMPNAQGDTIGNTLKDFVSDFGVPSFLTFDGAGAQAGRNTQFMKTIRNLISSITFPLHANQTKTRLSHLFEKSNGVGIELW